MTKRTQKILLLIFTGILVSLFFYTYLPVGTTYYGWVEVIEKKIDSDQYHLLAASGDDPINISIKDKESFLYFEEPGKSKEILISRIWNKIEINRMYFVRINTNILKSTYNLEEFYEY